MDGGISPGQEANDAITTYVVRFPSGLAPCLGRPGAPANRARNSVSDALVLGASLEIGVCTENHN